jgi:hypothetical protein
VRTSTVLVAVLFAIQSVWLLVVPRIEPMVYTALENIGGKRFGHAIIPAHLDEKAIRDRNAWFNTYGPGACKR